jgi:hypothetical protein
VPKAAEIAISDFRCGHRVERGRRSPFAHAFPSTKEEQLVFDDRSSERCSIHIAIRCWKLVSDEKEIPRLQVIVRVIGKRGAVKFVRTGLCHHGNRSAAGHSLFRVEVISRDINGLHRFLRRDIRRVMRQP